ncbi:putative exported protein [Halobacteriovorax marinus SJ]|uniref:Exported protein n=1 Tax=Halobacteriovorax marinus (strain ATCC BAA-682 / DSM 15412 / SJ) TaxID=862908 RepID=E1X2Y9_HALMS|nr:hypothetical protein [Halobacteriovorax marinus]CBW26819.1 putative exported protein [Halobacteriovorax marinus SJ]
MKNLVIAQILSALLLASCGGSSGGPAPVSLPNSVDNSSAENSNQLSIDDGVIAPVKIVDKIPSLAPVVAVAVPSILYENIAPIPLSERKESSRKLSQVGQQVKAPVSADQKIVDKEKFSNKGQGQAVVSNYPVPVPNPSLIPVLPNSGQQVQVIAPPVLYSDIAPLIVADKKEDKKELSIDDDQKVSAALVDKDDVDLLANKKDDDRYDYPAPALIQVNVPDPIVDQDAIIQNSDNVKAIGVDLYELEIAKSYDIADEKVANFVIPNVYSDIEIQEVQLLVVPNGVPDGYRIESNLYSKIQLSYINSAGNPQRICLIPNAHYFDEEVVGGVEIVVSDNDFEAVSFEGVSDCNNIPYNHNLVELGDYIDLDQSVRQSSVVLSVAQQPKFIVSNDFIRNDSRLASKVGIRAKIILKAIK